MSTAATTDTGTAPDTPAAPSQTAIRAMASGGWAAGIVIACLLMPFAPPTA